MTIPLVGAIICWYFRVISEPYRYTFKLAESSAKIEHIPAPFGSRLFYMEANHVQNQNEFVSRL